MIFVFWTLTSLHHLLSALSELPQPVNVAITSTNFLHMLTWEHGPGRPADIYYQIRISTDMGTAWVPVAACQHVQYPLVCNMTEAFSDPWQFYVTQVTAKLRAQASWPLTHPGFQPIKDNCVISAFLSIISIAVIIIVILLIYTGLLCLRKIHLPPVLTSVHHTKEALIVVPHKTSLSSLVIRPTLYFPCEEKDRQLSDLQDGERTSRNESGYKIRLNSNLPSLSSSSPSLLFSYQPGSRLNNTSNSIFLSFDVFSPLPQTCIWNDRLLNAASKHTSTTTGSLSDTLVNSNHSPFLDQASYMAERIQPIEVENWEDEKRDNQDVNLSSLILGRYVEEWDKTISDQSNVDTIDLEEHDRNSAMLPETWDTKEAHIQSTFCSDDEQQQDVQFSYMRR
ncbi:uncharacterized protein LOC133160231 isoform X4 [Syngnathus typhle]|uniref:uncharacterized protein LOC133160231 isoform X4 n=1 Tax=Syngnathus typhle TaxID=161592 RepID=UPI002A6A9647|nr:uncharacterized protein LOC133160231 isoform X4 [Syngnathus typhle]